MVSFSLFPTVFETYGTRYIPFVIFPQKTVLTPNFAIRLINIGNWTLCVTIQEEIVLIFKSALHFAHVRF